MCSLAWGICETKKEEIKRVRCCQAGVRQAEWRKRDDNPNSSDFQISMEFTKYSFPHRKRVSRGVANNIGPFVALAEFSKSS